MGKTKLTGKLMHLEPAKARMLEDLAKRSGVQQSVLMRSAIDKLLKEQGYEWEREAAPDGLPRRVHRLRKKRKP
jgi:hypothetical protein